MIAIVAAMPEELAPLLSRAQGRRALSPPARRPFELCTARLAGRPVALAVTGDGERNARLGAEALGATLAREQPAGLEGLEALVVVGIAGAGSAVLGPGALIVADEVSFETGRAWRADPSLVQAAARRTGARAARLVSATTIADSPAAKRALAARAAATGSDSPIAIDLESATYVEAAVRAGIPWTVLRVISDGLDEALPALLNRARDGGGAVRRGAVVRGLLGDPGALRVLWRMRDRLRDAGATLADAVERVLGPG